ncbi:uncharacterized protein LOC120129826 isoform X2 [Hibiscus syriacus]|uniref:uncharacterized protein LOC120129826 isoform X2 n=1 Tax=Hibiscus syriacus TaxID=106335 RepID=UPI001924A854|nr:uncharacterized protein LOC120129826 isoform X2 [Hibiscus syriacus]
MTSMAGKAGSSKNGSEDPVRKYTIQDPNNKISFTCSFCGQTFKGGVFRIKLHMIGGFKDARKCPNCPEHVREELNVFMMKKQTAKAEQHMQAKNWMHQQQDDEYDGEEEDVEIGGRSSKMPPPKKPRQKGPMDMYFTPNPREAIKARKEGRQQTINETCRKDLRDKVCHEIGRYSF